MRVYWSQDTRRELAKETASILKGQPYDSNRLMQAFRMAMKNVLLPEHQRKITGPTNVKWLQNMVANEIKNQNHTLAVIETNTDTNSLILDVLTSLDNQITEQNTTIKTLCEGISLLNMEIKKLAEIIIQKQHQTTKQQEERKDKICIQPLEQKPTMCGSTYNPKPLHVTIAGNLRGDQRNLIEQAITGLPYNIKLNFEDANRGPSQIPHFDEIIIMRWVPRRWAQTAYHRFPGRTHEATGIKSAIDLLYRLGRTHSGV